MPDFSLSYQDYLNANPQLQGGSEAGSSSYMSQDAWSALSSADQWKNLGGGLSIDQNDPRYAAIAAQTGGDPSRGLYIRSGALTDTSIFNDPSKVYQGNGFYAFDPANQTAQEEARQNSGGLSDRAWALAPLMVLGGGLAAGALMDGGALSGGAAGADSSFGLSVPGALPSVGAPGSVGALAGVPDVVGGVGGVGGAAGAGGAGLAVPGALPSVGAPGAVGALAETPSLAGLGGSGSGLLGALNTARTGLGGVSAISRLLGGSGATMPNGSGDGSGLLQGLLGLLGLGHQGYGNGIGTANGALANGQQAAGLADPWAQYRTPFAQQLTPDKVNSLLNPDPNAIKNDPAYQFQLQQGIGAINQGDAAQGTLRSGNRGVELAQYGQGLASTYEQQLFNNNMTRLGALGNLAGVNAGSPAASAQMLMGGFNNASDLRNSGLNGLFSGGANNPLSSLLSLFSSGASGVGDFFSNLFGSSGDGSGDSSFPSSFLGDFSSSTDFPSSFFGDAGP